MTSLIHRNASQRLALQLLSLALAGCNGSQSQTQAEPAAPTAVVVHTGGTASIPEGSPLRKSLQVAAVQQQTVERPILVCPA